MRRESGRRTDHRATTSIGALTRRDRHREAALNRKIDDAYASVSFTASRRRRRRQIREAHRHERALAAQRRRPLSALLAIGVALMIAIVALLASGASSTLALIAAALLFVDWTVIHRRRRLLEHS